MSTVIERANYEVLKCPLKKPYELSFTTIRELISIRVSISFSTGVTKMGEVVPLPVYSEESEEAILDFIKTKCKIMAGIEVENARDQISAFIPTKPFACSPFLTAIDLLEFEVSSTFDSIQFVLPVSTQNQNVIRGISELNGSETIKVKLSGEAQTDIEGLKLLFQSQKHGHTYRLDANQAYTLKVAREVFKWIDEHPIKNQISYIEQPFPVNDWENNAIIKSQFPEVEIMIDESIITEDHLNMSESVGAGFVKLKLFKQGGIKETIELAQLANQMGFKVILGNGVASKVSNDIENSIYLQYPHLFTGASEANGFLKLA